MKLTLPDYLLSIAPYVPGKPIEELEREYGIGDSIKLASNENPLGPSPLAVKAIHDAVAKLHRYPDGGGHVLLHKLSEYFNLPPQKIVLGNGSDEIIGMLAHALMQPGDEALIPSPSFLMYDISVRSAGGVPVRVPLQAMTVDLEETTNRITPQTRMIFICNPNNPTGTIVYKKDFEVFLDNLPPQVLVVIDEAYIEFVQDSGCAFGIDYLDDERPLVVLRTFSKAYGLAGLRIGYGLMPEKLAELLNRIRMPFNTNALAQIGASAAIADQLFLAQVRNVVHGEIAFLQAALDELGITYFPTQANFFMIDVKQNADVVFEKMLQQGIIVRSMKSYGYPNYIRINAGVRRESVRFIEALEKALA
jgi:histidinol-phosphate aminotransferase